MYEPEIKIQELRSYLGLTQREFAASVSEETDRVKTFAQSNVHEWESGARSISDRAAKACMRLAFRRWEQDRRAAEKAGGDVALVEKHWSGLLGDPILSVLVGHGPSLRAAKAASDPSQSQLALLALGDDLAQLVEGQVGLRPPVA